MFYTGDEYADDDCTSGPLEWCDQFTIFDDDTDEDGNDWADDAPVHEIDWRPVIVPAWGQDQ